MLIATRRPADAVNDIVCTAAAAAAGDALDVQCSFRSPRLAVHGCAEPGKSIDFVCRSFLRSFVDSSSRPGADYVRPSCVATGQYTQFFFAGNSDPISSISANNVTPNRQTERNDKKQPCDKTRRAIRRHMRGVSFLARKWKGRAIIFNDNETSRDIIVTVRNIFRIVFF